MLFIILSTYLLIGITVFTFNVHYIGKSGEEPSLWNIVVALFWLWFMIYGIYDKLTTKLS